MGRQAWMIGVLATTAPVCLGQELLRTHYQETNSTLSKTRTIGDIDGDQTLDYAILGSPATGRIFVFSGASGSSLGVLTSGFIMDSFGTTFDAAGDFDGDGTPDIVAGAPNWSSPTTNFVGAVFVFSGATLEPIVRIKGPEFYDFSLGDSVWGLGDVNGDGFADIGVTSTNAPNLRVYAGPDGHFLRWHLGNSPEPVACELGDVNGDSCNDYAVAWPSGYGLIKVFSGVDGCEIVEIPGDLAPPPTYLGTSISPAGDVTGDGIPDLWAGAPGSLVSTSYHGHVSLYSGADWSEAYRITSRLYDMPGVYDAMRLGVSVRGCQDVNGDGVPDVLVDAWRDLHPGSTWPPPGTIVRGSSTVYSGASGQRLFQVFGHPDTDGPIGRGFSELLDDLDGDGYPEWAVGYFDAVTDVTSDSWDSRVRIFKGGPGDAFRVCSAAPSALTPGVELDLARAISVSLNALRFQAKGLQAGETGIVFYGTPASPLPFGDGELCIARPAFRAAIAQASIDHIVLPDGRIWFDLDLTTGPFATPAGAVAPGTSWRFQMWYTDPAGPGGTGVNLTDAFDIEFTP